MRLIWSYIAFGLCLLLSPVIVVFFALLFSAVPSRQKFIEAVIAKWQTINWDK